jgi:hypothetical protein
LVEVAVVALVIVVVAAVVLVVDQDEPGKEEPLKLRVLPELEEQGVVQEVLVVMEEVHQPAEDLVLVEVLVAAVVVLVQRPGVLQVVVAAAVEVA